MSIIKHVTLQKIVAHDFRYDLRITNRLMDFERKVLRKYLAQSMKIAFGE